MKIYTKTGDHGETGLFAGGRVRKDHPRVEAYGAVDELNSSLGAARAAGLPAAIDGLIARVQHELFAVGAELATPDPRSQSLAVVGDHHVALLEEAIDGFEADLPPLRQFILPAGAPGACALHLARSICRRAERRVVSLVDGATEPVSERLIRYLNRLGDLLFVLARAANAAAGVADEPWRKPTEETPAP